MNPLPLNIPRNGKVEFNYLHPTTDPLALTPDILLISVPNDIYIDVGWYPENDPRGAYRISACRSDWREQLIEPIRTPNARVVAELVSRLAWMFVSQAVTSATWVSGLQAYVLERPVAIASGSTTAPVTARDLQHA